MSESRINYEYRNKSKEQIKIWLSVAPGTESVKFNITPLQKDNSFLGDIYYFEIPKGGKLVYTAKYTYVHKMDILYEERDYFLRSCELIPVNKNTQKDAQDIVKGITDKFEQAKTLFTYMCNNFKYSYRINERGFDACTASKKGDCGELSAVFASYCRSLGIPCRVMVGAFKGEEQLHAWNEAYFDNQGWIPIDVSLAMYSFLRHPLSNIGATIKWGALRKKIRYFGEIEKGRVVFSIDPERTLSPEYNEINNPTKDMRFPVGERMLSWGYETLDGKAPYMQPIYPQLNNTYKKITNRDVLGVSKVRPENIIDYITLKMKVNSFWLAALFVYFSIILEVFNASVHYLVDLFIQGSITILLGIFGTLTLIRREYNVPILILSIFFVFTIFGFLYSLI